MQVCISESYLQRLWPKTLGVRKRTLENGVLELNFTLAGYHGQSMKREESLACCNVAVFYWHKRKGIYWQVCCSRHMEMFFLFVCLFLVFSSNCKKNEIVWFLHGKFLLLDKNNGTQFVNNRKWSSPFILLLPKSLHTWPGPRVLFPFGYDKKKIIKKMQLNSWLDYNKNMYTDWKYGKNLKHKQLEVSLMLISCNQRV